MSTNTLDIRTVKAPTTDTYIDANDLLIELMTDLENCQNEGGKKELKRLIKRVREIRDKSSRKDDG